MYVWPSWPFHTREDWYYPIEVVDTVAGVLTKRGREMPDRTVLLNGDAFMDVSSAHIWQACTDEQKKPEIVVIRAEIKDKLPETEAIPVTILDFAVSPPFISDYLYIGATAPDSPGQEYPYEERFPQKADIEIKKMPDGIFLLSGWSLIKKDAEGQPMKVFYTYDRNTRTVQNVK